MFLSVVLLAIVVFGCAKSSRLEHDLDGGYVRENEDEGAFRLRSRDLLRQGYRLTVHDVKPFARAAVDQGNASSFKGSSGLYLEVWHTSIESYAR
jgi:hypothetical protein